LICALSFTLFCLRFKKASLLFPTSHDLPYLSFKTSLTETLFPSVFFRVGVLLPFGLFFFLTLRISWEASFSCGGGAPWSFFFFFPPGPDVLPPPPVYFVFLMSRPPFEPVRLFSQGIPLHHPPKPPAPHKPFFLEHRWRPSCASPFFKIVIPFFSASTIIPPRPAPFFISTQFS